MSLYGLQWTVSVAWNEGGLAGLLVGCVGQGCLWGVWGKDAEGARSGRVARVRFPVGPSRLIGCGELRGPARLRPGFVRNL